MNLRSSSARASLYLLSLASGVLLAQTLPAQSASTASASKVRIVRLSEVKGAVQLDRSNGRGLEPAIANLPVVERNRLQTGTGVAEVEFEDNSSLRLAPDSMLEFPELSRTAAGTTVSSVRLMKGMAYITMVKSKGNEFNLLFGEHTVAIAAGTHLRIDVTDNDARLAVLDGALKLDTPRGPLEVTKKKTVTLLMSSEIDASVAKNVDSNPLDAWDKQSTDYHARMAAMSAFGNSPYSYGVSDMLYYGAFSDAGGCGSMWRPYFTSASWEPYSAGAWAWSGAAYTWVSPYPWGWMPYYSGSWNYCPGAGWGWQPGGGWSGLNNGTLIAMNPSNGGKTHMPVAPPHPPAPGSPVLVPVISKPLVRSELGSRNSFVFRNDSAGFGVPRGELGQLNKFSAQAVSKGATRTTVYLSVEPRETSRVTPANSAVGTISIHRGSPPPPRDSESSSSSSGSSSFGGGGTSSSSLSSSSSSGGAHGSPAPAPSGGGGRPH
jgi:hypothetical protein